MKKFIYFLFFCFLILTFVEAGKKRKSKLELGEEHMRRITEELRNNSKSEKPLVDHEFIEKIENNHKNGQ